MSAFQFDLDLSTTLTVDDIWPDGDAPENPTVAEVIAVVRNDGPLRNFVRDWEFLTGATLYVDGEEALSS